jgi:hypothetical protein
VVDQVGWSNDFLHAFADAKPIDTRTSMLSVMAGDQNSKEQYSEDRPEGGLIET